MSALVRQRCLCAALALVLAVAPRAALADETERQRAIEIGQTGLELYEKGQYGVALERFRTADRVSHSPVFLLYAARCLERLGQLREAKQLYEELVIEQLPTDAPAAWHAATNDGARELAALSKRVPSVRIRVTGGRAVSLKLDGVVIDSASAAGEIWLDPGSHQIEAQGESGSVVRQRVELNEGERHRVVELALPVAARPASAPARQAPATKPQRASAEVANNPATDGFGVVLLAGAGLGLAAGAVTGFMAASKLDDIRENCVGNRCRQSDESAGETVQTLALVSTIGFAAGGLALGAWTLRVVLTPPVSESSASIVQIAGTF